MMNANGEDPHSLITPTNNHHHNGQGGSNSKNRSIFVNKSKVHAYQVRALLYKQLTLQLRQKKTVACQVIFPIVMLLCIFLFNVIMKKAIGRFPKPPPTPVVSPSMDVARVFEFIQGRLSPLSPEETPFFPFRFMYTKSNPNTVQEQLGVLGPNGQKEGFFGFMDQTDANDTLGSIGVSKIPYAVYMKNASDMDNLVYNSQKSRGSMDGYYGSLEFTSLITSAKNDSSNDKNNQKDIGIQYTVQSVSDCSLFTAFEGRIFPGLCNYGFTASLMNMVNNAFVESVLGNLAFKINTAIQKMPYINNLDISALMFDNSAQIIHLVLLFPLPMFIYTLLLEKTTRIREMMKLNGMRMKYYWITYLAFNATIYFLFTCALCYICSLAFGFKWAYSNPLAVIIFFVACCANIMGMAIFLSSILNSVLVGIILGYLGALFFPSITNLVETYIISKSGNQFLFLLLIPPFATEHALTSGFVNPCKNFQCPTFKVFTSWNPYVAGVVFMFLNGILYSALGLYLDAIMPREWGITKHPLFFLSPLKTLFLKLFKSKRSHYENSNETISLLGKESDIEEGVETAEGGKDADVEKEREKVHRVVSALKNESLEHVPPIVIENLNKFYGSFQAVKDVSLMIESGTCFGLLGPNGAGKTTTCNMLCGLAKPSKGTAYINGFDIRSEMDMVQRSMGLAPQYEVIYDDLTVEEHLLFYARLKGVPKREERAHVESIMESVGLHLPEHRVKTAQQLSGGMRRRLSLAMALCGDPVMILCDEPTTGLDPTSRRQVWSIIQKQKEQGRCIILTTHSLDEADVLCDRIGIVKTQLMCIGSSFHLKSKYGQSYRLTMNYHFSQSRPAAESAKMIEDFVKTNICPTMTSSSQYAGNLVLELPKADILVDISRLFNLIEDYKAETRDLVEEYNFSQTTLEDVFMAITATGDEANKFT